ncbi:hypothetical protein BC829DRAFT_380728, partial [Chytridium lagenaria]
ISTTSYHLTRHPSFNDVFRSINVLVSSASTVAVLALGMLLPSVNADFVLSSPLTRGFSASRLSQAPCGGFNDFVNLVNFPIRTEYTGQYTVNIAYPTGFRDAEFYTIGRGAVPQFFAPVPLPINMTTAIDLTKEPLDVIRSPNVVFEGASGRKYYQANPSTLPSNGMPASNASEVSPSIPILPTTTGVATGTTTFPATGTTALKAGSGALMNVAAGANVMIGMALAVLLAL